MKTEEQDEQTSQLFLCFRALVYFQNLNRFWMSISLLNNVNCFRKLLLKPKRDKKIKHISTCTLV